MWFRPTSRIRQPAESPEAARMNDVLVRYSPPGGMISTVAVPLDCLKLLLTGRFLLHDPCRAALSAHDTRNNDHTLCIQWPRRARRDGVVWPEAGPCSWKL